MLPAPTCKGPLRRMAAERRREANVGCSARGVKFARRRILVAAEAVERARGLLALPLPSARLALRCGEPLRSDL